MGRPVSSDFEVMQESGAEHPREREQQGERPGCKRVGESVWEQQGTASPVHRPCHDLKPE